MRNADGERMPDAVGLVPGARVALMVNSLGATTAMELSVAARAALARLAAMQASTWFGVRAPAQGGFGESAGR